MLCCGVIPKPGSFQQLCQPACQIPLDYFPYQWATIDDFWHSTHNTTLDHCQPTVWLKVCALEAQEAFLGHEVVLQYEHLCSAKRNSMRWIVTELYPLTSTLHSELNILRVWGVPDGTGVSPRV